MMQDRLIGTWQLVSCQLISSDDQVTYPYGKDAIGYLIYTKDKYMSVNIMVANRTKFNTEELVGGTIKEKAIAAETYLSYCAKYEVQKDKVIHYVEASLFPNWIGVVQERFLVLEGKKLALTTPPFLVNGKQKAAHLIWERVLDI